MLAPVSPQGGDNRGWWKKPWGLGWISSICVSRNISPLSVPLCLLAGWPLWTASGNSVAISISFWISSAERIVRKADGGSRWREVRLSTLLAVSLLGSHWTGSPFDWKPQALSRDPIWVPGPFMPWKASTPEPHSVFIFSLVPSLVVYLLPACPSANNPFNWFPFQMTKSQYGDCFSPGSLLLQVQSWQGQIALCWLYCFLAVGPWASFLTSLSPRFLISKSRAARIIAFVYLSEEEQTVWKCHVNCHVPCMGLGAEGAVLVVAVICQEL